MSDLVQPLCETLVSLIAAMDEANLGELRPFRHVGIVSKGMIPNPPSAWVMPIRTQFPDQGDRTGRQMVHQVTVRLGIQGTDPDKLARDCMGYVQAVDAMIQATPSGTWPNSVLQVFVSEHDYGPLYGLNGALAFWPDIHLLFLTEEQQ